MAHDRGKSHATLHTKEVVETLSPDYLKPVVQAVDETDPGLA